MVHTAGSTGWLLWLKALHRGGEAGVVVGALVGCRNRIKWRGVELNSERS
jgi:hypothetical protein